MNGDAECAVALDDDATGCDVKADVCLMDEKGDAVEENAPNDVCAFLTVSFVDDSVDLGSETDKVFASLTFAATSSGKALVALPSKPVEGVAIFANGDAVDAKLPNVACVFFAGAGATIFGSDEASRGI